MYSLNAVNIEGDYIKINKVSFKLNIIFKNIRNSLMGLKTQKHELRISFFKF